MCYASCEAPYGGKSSMWYRMTQQKWHEVDAADGGVVFPSTHEMGRGLTDTHISKVM